jgi:hypothetical protein
MMPLSHLLRLIVASLMIGALALGAAAAACRW